MGHDIHLYLNNWGLGKTSDLEKHSDEENAVIEPKFIPVNNLKDYEDIPVIDMQEDDNFKIK